MESQYSENGMFVLVGGEAKVTQGGLHAHREFQHTSIPFIGSAYQSLRNAGVSRDRIIVIAQIKDYLHDTLGGWLQTAPESQKRFIQDEIMRTTTACSKLIEEGGADYDHEFVNPSTVLNVLTGKKFTDGKVIPSEHRGPIFLAVYSHGDSHPTKAGLEGPHHSLTAEWFAHMPYPTPDHHQHYYDFVATQHANKDTSGASLAPCLLYSTQLRQCFHSLFQQQPNRPIVGLLNYCRSGGGLEFMRNHITRQHLGVDQWPLFLMSSSDAHVDSLVGGFWDAWFGSFCRLIPNISSSSSNPESSLSSSSSMIDQEEWQHNPYLHHSHDKLSLRHIYQDASNRYFEENLYALMNEVKERSFSHQIWSLEFTWPDSKPGNYDPWHLDLKSHLVADKDGLHGEPNYEIVASLQEAYTTGKAFRVLLKSEALLAGIDLDKGAAELDDDDDCSSSRATSAKRGKRGRRNNDVKVVVWMGRRHRFDYGPERWSEELAQLDRKLASKGLPPSRPYSCQLTAWKGSNQGKLVNLVDVVKESLKVVARPGVVFGEKSNVEQVSVIDFFGSEEAQTL